MANARSRALRVMHSMKSAIGIATGSMNIFMAILVEAWERPIKLAGLDWSQNSFCNKANTAQLSQNPIHSRIREAGVPVNAACQAELKSLSPLQHNLPFTSSV